MKKLLIAFILVTGMVMNAQQIEQKSFIEINAEANEEVTPDEIYLTISLKESDSKGKISIEEQEENLKKALTSLGINIKEDLKVNNANSYYYRKIFKKDTYASKDFQLKLKDAEQVAKVFQKLNDLNVSLVNIEKLEYSKREELLKELRMRAVKEAKERATYMLSAIGETVGKPLEIRDNSYYHPIVYRNQPVMMMEAKVSDGYAPPMPELDFKKIELKANVNVKFEIQ